MIKTNFDGSISINYPKFLRNNFIFYNWEVLGLCRLGLHLLRGYIVKGEVSIWCDGGCGLFVSVQDNE